MITSSHTNPTNLSSYYPNNMDFSHHNNSSYSHPQQQHQQQAQQAQFSNGYHMGQPFEGWPGVTLKHIMGQIDLFNGGYGNNTRWGFQKDTPVHEGTGSGFDLSGGNFTSRSANTMAMFQQNYKAGSGLETCQTPNAQSGSAFLGPQLWNQKLGMDFMNQDPLQNISQENCCSPSSTFTEIKTESSLDWFGTENVKEKEQDKTFVEVPEDDFSAADIALASIPGSAFDPRTRSFSPEELKPLPVIRKRMKMYVSDCEKTEEYWAKRVKNNIAARRSREAKRVKDNQIALRTAFLEKENSALRIKISTLTDRNKDIQRDVDCLKNDIKILKSI